MTLRSKTIRAKRNKRTKRNKKGGSTRLASLTGKSLKGLFKRVRQQTPYKEYTTY